MIRDLMHYLDASFCAEIAILIFFGVFFAVTIRTLLSSKKLSADQAAIPLTDGTEINRS